MTRSFFAQRNFDDKSILVDLFNSFEAAAAAAAESAEIKRQELEAQEKEEEEERRQKEEEMEGLRLKSSMDRKGKGRASPVGEEASGAVDDAAVDGEGREPREEASPAAAAAETPYDRASQPPISPRTRHSRRLGSASLRLGSSPRLRDPTGDEEDGGGAPTSPPLEEKERAAEESGEMYMGECEEGEQFSRRRSLLAQANNGGFFVLFSFALTLIDSFLQAPPCGNWCTASGSRRSCSSNS